jgi:small subunit ribosomal protein S21
MNRVESELMASGKTDETIDSMLRRFKKRVIDDGILDEVRKKQFFMSKSLKRAEKSKRARIRDLKASKKRKK